MVVSVDGATGLVQPLRLSDRLSRKLLPTRLLLLPRPLLDAAACRCCPAAGATAGTACNAMPAEGAAVAAAAAAAACCAM